LLKTLKDFQKNYEKVGKYYKIKTTDYILIHLLGMFEHYE